MTDTLSPSEFAQWTPAARHWHARKFPSTWPMIEQRLRVTELAIRLNEAMRQSKKQADNKRILSTDIIKLCTAFSGVSVAELKSRDHHKDIYTIRMAAMYLIEVYCPHLSPPRIGRELDRDRTTVIHARNRVTADLASGGARFGAIVNYVQARLR